MRALILVPLLFLTACASITVENFPVSSHIDTTFTKKGKVALITTGNVNGIEEISSQNFCTNSGCRKHKGMDHRILIKDSLAYSIFNGVKSVYPNIERPIKENIIDDYEKVVEIEINDHDVVYSMFWNNPEWDSSPSAESVMYYLSANLKVKVGQDIVVNENIISDISQKWSFKNGRISIEDYRTSIGKSLDDFARKISARLESHERGALIGSALRKLQGGGSPDECFAFIQKYGDYKEALPAFALTAKLISRSENRIALYGRFIAVHPRAAEYVPEEMLVYYLGPPGMKIYQLIEMRQAGISDVLMASKINSAEAIYKDFTLQEIAQLHKIGLSDELIAAMIQSTVNATRLAEQRRQMKEIRQFQEQQAESKRQQAAEAQRRLAEQQAAQQKDSGDGFLKFMAIGLGAVAIGSADIPTDVAVDAIGSLATDVMLETGGTNSMDFNERMANRTSASSASTSMAARSGDSKKTRQISFTCPSGVKFNSPFEYRTEACFSAAENFSRVSTCNESNMAIVQSQQRCKAACGREDCYEP